MMTRFWIGLVESQRNLGAWLRFRSLVPLTFLFWIASGQIWTLPPGPLCDEGMVLFMEGGCDWGLSNLFFFAKVSLLVAINVALVGAWIRRLDDWRGFGIHLVLLLSMSWVFRSGEACRTYYDHPNGSLGQMILEMACFALLGIAVGQLVVRFSWVSKLVAWFLWNGSHVGLFYGFLRFTDHWTGLHTVLLSGSLLALAALLFKLRGIIESRSRSAAAKDPEPARPRIPFAERLSLFFVASVFLIFWNPGSMGRLILTCGVTGFLTHALVIGRISPSRSIKVVALLTFAPLIGSLGSAAWEYHRYSRFAEPKIEVLSRIQSQEARELRQETRQYRDERDDYPRVDLLKENAAIRSMAERMLPKSLVAKSPGVHVELLVPLDWTHFAAIHREGGFGIGHIVNLRTGYPGGIIGRHSDLDFIEKLLTTHRSQSTTFWGYLLERGLRRNRPVYYAGHVVLDEHYRPQALAILRMIRIP